MFLTGRFPRTVDEKHRVAIPKKLRDAFTNKEQESVVFVAPGTDGSLALYTEESFARLADRLSASSPTGQDVRAFSRLFFSQAERVDMDGQGRIRIPTELVKHAQITKEIMLLGVRDHLELWDKGRWDSYIEVQQSQYDSLAEKAFSKE